MLEGDQVVSTGEGSKPDWLRVKAPAGNEYASTMSILRKHKLVTVCEEAACPNVQECWSKFHAAFMILGDVCTRSCRFCNVKKGIPCHVDADEPMRLARTVRALGLKHVVITSVTRDDLLDGGALHFVKCIRDIRDLSPKTTVEILTPDFLNQESAIHIIAEELPDVYNHNVETVPSLYKKIRSRSVYSNSLGVLRSMKQLAPEVLTKSGIMLGLGEKQDEVLGVMDDLRSVGVDLITIGQYLQPTPMHVRVERFVEPKEFEYYASVAYRKGFRGVASSPFTRSSHNAGSLYLEAKS